MCSFYASSEGLRKLRFAAKHKFCVYLTSRLQLKVNVELLQIFCVFITPPPHVRGNEELREKKRNFRSTIFCIGWVLVFDGCRPRSVRHLWATGGCPRKDWSFCRPNLVPLHMFHAFDGSAEAYLCFHEISSKGKIYRGRR